MGDLSYICLFLINFSTDVDNSLLHHKEMEETPTWKMKRIITSLTRKPHRQLQSYIKVNWITSPDVCWIIPI